MKRIVVLALSWVCVVLGLFVVARTPSLPAFLWVGTCVILSFLILMGKGQKSDVDGQFLQESYEAFEGIFDAARTLYRQSEKLQKIVSSESSAVDRSSSAVTEISSMLEKTASGAQSLAQISSSSEQSAEQGEQQVKDVNELLQAVKGSSQELESTVATNLKELGKIVTSLNSIKTKTTMINDIVFQTKLLSFNASVEAARAGEAGKGFAVVAEEMGKLARVSGEASQQIDAILVNSMSETHSLIESVTGSIKSQTVLNVSNVDKALAQSAKTVESFNQLIELVRKTSAMSAEISGAAREQDMGVKEVSSSLDTLQQSSGGLSSVADTVYKTSFSLSKKTDVLGVKLAEFAKRAKVEIRVAPKKFDFDAAIAAHVDWKMKLSGYMQKPDGSLKAEKVCVDHACALGTWIYGEGQVYRNAFQNDFEKLRQSHAEFHKTAGGIITLIDQQRLNEARQLMAPGGKYMNISDQTVSLIEALRDKVQHGHPHQESNQVAASTVPSPVLKSA